MTMIRTALFSHFIACGVWEAVYHLDGLLKSESDIRPDTVHGDTQRRSEPIFGLAHLLGIQLMPRMRTRNKVAFYRRTPLRPLSTLIRSSPVWISFQPISNRQSPIFNPH